MIYKIKRKVKELLIDFKNDVIFGNHDSRKMFYKKYKGDFKREINKINSKKYIENEKKVYNQLCCFLNELKNHKSNDLIFLFSGTTFIQEKRGNRPIRLTNAWLSDNVPVMFSYYRWNKQEDIPKYTTPNLFQLPIDYTMKYIDEIIDYDFGDKNKVFIVSFPYPELARYIGKLNMRGWKVVYDVRDNWEEFHKVNMARWYEESAEKFFVANSDVVCCVAKPLQEKMQSYTNNKKVLLSPNALDRKFLKTAEEYNIKENNSLNVKIGYVGHLSAAWFDWDSLIKVAELKPKWNLEIIGHFEPKGMKLPKNLKLLGSKEHSKIMDIAQSWNAAIIPFKIGELSDCVDPIKVYEYLAMGLPVVSFRMPQIHDYPHVYIADNVQAFVNELENAVNDKFDIDSVNKFLEVNMWENRSREIIEWTKTVTLLEEFQQGVDSSEVTIYI